MINHVGTAINLDHVSTVEAYMRVRGAWFAAARRVDGHQIALSEDMATKEEAVAWIAKRFDGDFDQHCDEAAAIARDPRSLQAIMRDDSLTDEERVAEARITPGVIVEEFDNTWRLIEGGGHLMWEVRRA